MERQARNVSLPRVLIQSDAHIRKRISEARPGGNHGVPGRDHRRNAVAALHSVGVLNRRAIGWQTISPPLAVLP